MLRFAPNSSGLLPLHFILGRKDEIYVTSVTNRSAIHCYGLALIPCLCMIISMSLWILSDLQWLSLSKRELNTNNDAYEIQKAALSIMKHHHIGTIPAISAQKIQLSQGHIYHYHHRDWQYLVEDLGYYRCFRLTIADTSYGTHHMRITIKPKLKEHPILQIRFVRPYRTKNCHKKPIILKQRIMSWRLF